LERTAATVERAVKQRAQATQPVARCGSAVGEQRGEHVRQHQRPQHLEQRPRTVGLAFLEEVVRNQVLV